MGDKVFACFYIDKEVLEAARHVGLNLSRVSENALVEAIRRLGDRGKRRAPRARITLRAEAGI